MAKERQSFVLSGILFTNKLWSIECNVRNRLVKVIDPENGANKPTVYEYDALGRKVKVTDPEGRVVRYEYDGEGNLVKLVRGRRDRRAVCLRCLREHGSKDKGRWKGN